MDHFLARMLFAYLALFPILNPPAMAPVFLQLTASVPSRNRNRLAWRIGLYTFCFLTSLLLVGGWLLRLLGISIAVISVAGGLLLFHSAWHMLNRDPKLTDSEKADIRSSMMDKAFYPLTMPVTAGPGSMAVTLSLVPTDRSFGLAMGLHYLAVALGIGLAAATVFVFYRFGSALIRRMGKTGEATISQISAFILLAVGVQIIWNGLRMLIHGL